MLSYPSACLWHLPWHFSGCTFQKHGLQPTDEKVEAIREALLSGNVSCAEQLYAQVVNARSSPIRAHWEHTLELVAEL